MFHIPLKFSYMCVCVWQTLLVSPLNMPLTMCAQVWVTRKPLCGGRCLHICLMHFSSYKCPECPQYPFIHTQWCPQTVDLRDPSGLSPGKRLCGSRDTKVSFTWFGLFTLQAEGTGYTHQECVRASFCASSTNILRLWNFAHQMSAVYILEIGNSHIALAGLQLCRTGWL